MLMNNLIYSVFAGSLCNTGFYLYNDQEFFIGIKILTV